MPFIRTNRTGTGFNTGQTGAQSGGAGGGGTPVLLDGLIGWALTTNANQTLSSAGVVANGPYNGTVHSGLSPNGPISFSADGADIPGPATGAYDEGIFVVNGSGISTGMSSWAFSALVRVDDAAEGYGRVIRKADNSGGEWAIDWNGAGEGFYLQLYLYGPEQNFPVYIDTPTLNEAEVYAVTGGWDDATNQLFLRVDDGDELVAAWSLGNIEQSGSLTFGCTADDDDNLSMYLDGKIKYVRFWKGQESTTSARNAASWLANMSGGVPIGRTDAEVADYTG